MEYKMGCAGYGSQDKIFTAELYNSNNRYSVEFQNKDGYFLCNFYDKKGSSEAFAFDLRIKNCVLADFLKDPDPIETKIKVDARIVLLCIDLLNKYKFSNNTYCLDSYDEIDKILEKTPVNSLVC